jgi:hypothetical protein
VTQLGRRGSANRDAATLEEAERLRFELARAELGANDGDLSGIPA